MFKKLISPYFWLFRSHLNTLFYAWPTFIGMIAASKAFPSLFLAIESTIAMLAIAMSVYVYNDIFDVKLDKISAEAGNPRHINRPLVTGKASISDAEVFVLAQTMIGLGIGFLVNLQFFFLLSLYLGLGVSYSTPPINLKEKCLFKQLTIALGHSISSLAGGGAVGVISRPVMYSAALFFTLTFGVVPINDLRDIQGDQKIGRRALPIVMGPKATIRVSLVTVTIALFVSALSYSWLGFNFAFSILIGISSLTLLFSLIKISNNWNNPIYIEKIKKRILWPVSITFQLGILVGLIYF